MKVTFTDSNLNGGNLLTQTCDIPAVYNGNLQGSSCTVTAMTMSTKDGWTFNGWATSSSATSGSIASGGTITVTQDTTYYATWKKNAKTYTVTFTDSHLGGGNLGTQTCNIAAVYNGATQATSCTVLPISIGTTIHQGWTFNGWATSSSATSGTMSTSVPITVTQDTTY